jgi:hypothetical protein
LAIIEERAGKKIPVKMNEVSGSTIQIEPRFLWRGLRSQAKILAADYADRRGSNQ